MAVARRMLPDLSGLDADALRALVLAQQEELACRDPEIENLKLLVLKLKRMQFGRKSEKLDKQIEQLELRLEDLEANQSIRPASPSTNTHTAPISKPVRKPLPEQLPREIETERTHASAFIRLRGLLPWGSNCHSARPRCSLRDDGAPSAPQTRSAACHPMSSARAPATRGQRRNSIPTGLAQAG
jgi:hypothetical protein